MKSLIIVLLWSHTNLILILICDYFEWIVMVIDVDMEEVLEQPHIFIKCPILNAAHEPGGIFQAMKKTSYY
jgi:hypothetical protein